MRRPVALLFSLLVAGHATAQEIVDGIAAQVGSEIVLVSEVYQVAEPTERRIRESGGTDQDVAMLRAEILERMIERALVRQVVRRAELDATEAEIDIAIEGIANENGLTVQELKQSVEAQGLPFQGYRERIRSEIEHAKVVNGVVGGRVRVEEQEIRALYDQEYGDQPAGGMEVHLRHILIGIKGDAPADRDEAREKAERALQRIREGVPFEAVAAEVSEVQAERGGDIGWFHLSALAGWMTTAIEPLPEGGTSDVIEMPFGCNLLQVVEKRPYEEITFEIVRPRLAEYLYQKKLGEEYMKFIEELRKQTYIERKGMFAEAARLGDDRETGLDDIDLGLGDDTF